ncbi:MAG: hypothetical protein HFJ53_06880 [Clostridia bacterium]|nr:hypothetical protein [Clostridia bacterium]
MNNLVFFNTNAKKVCDNVNNLRSMWPPKVEDNKILNEYLESRNFISNGNKQVSEIENNMSSFLKTKYFSFFDSGASALHAALIACNISYGDEVIVPAWTFPAPAFQILRVGAVPIFADIRQDTYNIDENNVIKLLKKFKKVKAIIAVHMQGYPCNIKKLREIADNYNIKLIEDCAQAFGAKINNKYVGTYGDIGCFSFMPAKQLASCGELGGICTNNVELFNNANSVKTYAQKIIEGDSDFYYNSFTYGYNYKPSVLNCLFLKYQLENFNNIINKIQNNANRLTQFLNNNINFLLPPKLENGYEHVYHLYRISCNTSNLNIKNTGKFREVIMKILEKEGLTTRLYQTHPVYKQKIFQQIFNKDKTKLYPWRFNEEYIELYKENYSDSSHRQTLEVIDNTFAIGDISSAPFYLMNDKIVDLYIQGLKKIAYNIDELIEYCNNEKSYFNPYNEICRLSDTKGIFM